MKKQLLRAAAMVVAMITITISIDMGCSKYDQPYPPEYQHMTEG